MYHSATLEVEDCDACIARTACPVCAQPLRPPADRHEARHEAYERAAFTHEEAYAPAQTRQAYPPLGAVARVRHHLAGEAELTPRF